MQESPAQRALTASGVALALALTAIALFLPPLAEATLASVLRVVGTGLALAIGLLLHWVFLGIAAHRMGRSRGGWVGLAVLLFPVGSVAALVLLSWFAHEGEPSTAAPAPHHG